MNTNRLGLGLTDSKKKKKRKKENGGENMKWGREKAHNC